MPAAPASAANAHRWGTNHRKSSWRAKRAGFPTMRRAAKAALALPHKRAGGSAVRPYSARTAPGFSRQRKAAGRRGSSEDDLPLRLNHAQDLGVGRGLNPAPDERGPATR